MQYRIHLVIFLCSLFYFSWCEGESNAQLNAISPIKIIDKHQEGWKGKIKDIISRYTPNHGNQSNATSAPTQVSTNGTGTPTNITGNLTQAPTNITGNLTQAPTNITGNLTQAPTNITGNLTQAPTNITGNLTQAPTNITGNLTQAPTNITGNLTQAPTSITGNLTQTPSTAPTNISRDLTEAPTMVPTVDWMTAPSHSVSTPNPTNFNTPMPRTFPPTPGNLRKLNQDENGVEIQQLGYLSIPRSKNNQEEKIPIDLKNIKALSLIKIFSIFSMFGATFLIIGVKIYSRPSTQQWIRNYGRVPQMPSDMEQ